MILSGMGMGKEAGSCFLVAGVHAEALFGRRSLSFAGTRSCGVRRGTARLTQPGVCPRPTMHPRQTCTYRLKTGTSHRVAMENALVAFGASLKKACQTSDMAPTITTSDGKIMFDADDHTFMRRRRDTVSLFDMSDKVDATEASLSALVKKTTSDRTGDLADRADDLAAQGTPRRTVLARACVIVCVCVHVCVSSVCAGAVGVVRVRRRSTPLAGALALISFAWRALYEHCTLGARGRHGRLAGAKAMATSSAPRGRCFWRSLPRALAHGASGCVS